MRGNIIKLEQDKDICYVFALKRSGHHAVMDWFMPCLGFNLMHHNNCSYLKSGNIVSFGSCSKKEYSKNLGYRRIFNFEDQSLNNLKKIPANVKKVMVIRDPYNNFASRVKHTDKNIFRNFNFDIWISYAREFIGETNYLGDNVIKVIYNNWFKSQEYRDLILKKIRSNFSFIGVPGSLDNVPKFGDGSTFDGFSFDGSAREMDVLNRWKKIKNENILKKMLFDDELYNLTKIIFGESVAKRVKIL